MAYRIFIVFIVILSLLSLGKVSPSSAALQVSRQAYHIEVIKSNTEGILLEFTLSEYKIEKLDIEGITYHKPSFPGVDYLEKPNMPGLPFVTALIGVPANIEPKLIILEKQSQLLSGSFNLLPNKEPLALERELQAGGYAYPKSTAVELLSIRGMYPEVPVQILGDAWLRDQRILQIGYYPFQYNPSNRNLVWNKTLEVEIQFDPGNGKIGEPISEHQIAASPFEDILESSLLNYESARLWRASPEQLQDAVSSQSDDCVVASLSNGAIRYRIPIDHDGIYRLTYDTLTAAGVPVAGMNLQDEHFHLTNQGREVAIYLHNRDSNNSFNAGDYLLFYGQHFNGSYLAETCYPDEDENWRAYSSQDINGTNKQWFPEFNAAMIEKYTDQNVYFLEINDSPILAMQNLSNESGSAPNPESYRSVIHEEESNTWHTLHFTSEDTWFWERIVVSSSTTRSYLTSISAPVYSESNATLRGEIVARTDNTSSSPDHHVELFINDDSHLDPIAMLNWDGRSAIRFEATFPQSILNEGENRLDLVAEKLFGDADQLYFNWFEIEYQRKFTAQTNRIHFETDQAGKWEYIIDGFQGVSANDIWVFGILDSPLQPFFYTNVPFSENQIRFTVTHEAGAEFYIGNVEDVPSSEISTVVPLNLDIPAEYLIITHSTFLSAAQELADYRATKSLTARVYDLNLVISEFNFGIYHPIAIKNFIRYTFENWQRPPSYVLLIGDGHWNFKSYPNYNAPQIYMPPNLSWVDPWQGEVDSANLLATVVDDDPLADVMIARMPVNSESQLTSVIEKIIHHESAPDQAWQRHFLYVADNTPDPAGDFVASAEKLISDYVDLGYIADRIYLDDFSEEDCIPDGTRLCPAATQALISQINQVGAQFVNYFGHAGVSSWADEKLLVNEDIDTIENSSRLPIFLSSTCLDGYWIHPNVSPSLIETLIVANGKGAVGAFASTGLGVSTGHDHLQDGFYKGVFVDQVDSIGLASVAAKLKLFEAGVHPDLLHTFTVFGDPALGFNVKSMHINYLSLIVR